ncbi:MAG: DUF6345 domain-containing protein [Jiangellaceae bacterium]
MTQSFPTVVPSSAQLETVGTHASPIAPSAGADRGGSHTVGALSVENFASAGPLTYTHDDAIGFLQWLERYGVTRNFWLADGGVKTWAYYEDYDNWQDTYGIDADLITYHSGHGGMDGNGVFYAPMGATWSGNDTNAVSSNMAVGNEYCRYLFWSTCFSLRVLDGHSPIRTWGGPNRGLRMILGYETVSIDSPNYGRFFGNHWNAGESISTAWLNASWDISHHQAPSATAWGANAQEAQNRCYNERFFEWGTVSNAWMWWRWYYAAAAVRELNQTMPTDPMMAKLAPFDARSARAAADAFGFDASGLTANGIGSTVEDGRRRLTIGPDGTLVAQLATANLENRQPLDQHDAQSVAVEAMHRYGLDLEGPMILDRIAHVNEAGAAHDDPESVRGPYQTGTLVQYRQTINGIPVITPAAGTIQVLVDNDGVATSVTSRARGVDDLTEHVSSGPLREPTPPGAAQHQEAQSQDPDRLLAKAFSERLRRLAASSGDMPIGFAVVPGTTEIGYDVEGDTALLAAQREVELDFGSGIKKRYLLKARI